MLVISPDCRREHGTVLGVATHSGGEYPERSQSRDLAAAPVFNKPVTTLTLVRLDAGGAAGSETKQRVGENANA
jgi:hypothetical protein